MIALRGSILVMLCMFTSAVATASDAEKAAELERDKQREVKRFLDRLLPEDWPDDRLAKVRKRLTIKHFVTNTHIGARTLTHAQITLDKSDLDDILKAREAKQLTPQKHAKVINFAFGPDSAKSFDDDFNAVPLDWWKPAECPVENYYAIYRTGPPDDRITLQVCKPAEDEITEIRRVLIRHEND
jgi:hypothetical protein